MATSKIIAKPETACTRFSRISIDPTSVGQFIQWLCGIEPIHHFDEEESDRDHIEISWGWHAPRQRMAKLLWQLIHEDSSQEFFDQQFSYGDPIRGKVALDLLAQIQARIRWVLEGALQRLDEDRQIGQGDWGECWWLPGEQTDYVRKQLRNVTADIVEQLSEYDDSLKHYLNALVCYQAKSIEVPCRDRNRSYNGVRNPKTSNPFVRVLGEDGKEFPLRQSERAYCEPDGVNFEWGYGGSGPYALAQSLLTDALDGDYGFCDRETIVVFREEFLETYPREEDLRISRTQILKWVQKRGQLEAWKARRPMVAEAGRSVSKKVRETLNRLTHVRRAGGLVSQRFDLVPSSFESALCLDVMRMLESSDYAMPCARCKLPISNDGSSRANHQRARARRGQPVYHEECRREQARLRKKLYWRRKASTEGFRESERQRARINRKSI
jgi:hypothetical protein